MPKEIRKEIDALNDSLLMIRFDLDHLKQKLMVISNQSVPASYLHFLLPRTNKNGFLLAKTSDWESLSLLPGQANIYFNKTYVGQTVIDPTIFQDTLEVSLGRDQGVISTCKKIKEDEKRLLISRRIEKTLTFEIEVSNTSQACIVLELEDLVPITENRGIQIKMVDKGGAEYDAKTGHLKWKVQMNPEEKKTVRFTYSIEHEKGGQ